MPKLLFLIILALGISLSGCGGGDSSPAAVNPPPSNQAPTANAGADQSIDEGTTVNLSGAGADSDGTVASYSWQQESGTTVTITNANMANASFVAPTVAASEVLLFRLTVTDDDGATGSDTVTVTVNDIAPPPPPPPVPNASPGGIWTGIDSDGDLVLALVTETGRFHFLDEFGNQGSGILSVSNGNDVAGNFQLVTPLGFTFPDGTTLADCTLSGTVTERQTMSVTANCTTTAGLQDQITVALDYEAIYDRDSSLATIAGNYDDGSGIVTNIFSDGTIFEQDPVSGCVTNGQVSVIDSAFNAYDFEFGFNRRNIMSEAIAIQPKNDKEYALKQCCGRLLRHSWQIEAAGNMIRDITESDMDQREDTEVVLCNGLLAANSLLMTGLDELQNLLDLPLPDWDEIKKNQPGGMDIVSAIENAEEIAEGQKD